MNIGSLGWFTFFRDTKKLCLGIRFLVSKILFMTVYAGAIQPLGANRAARHLAMKLTIVIIPQDLLIAKNHVFSIKNARSKKLLGLFFV